MGVKSINHYTLWLLGFVLIRLVVAKIVESKHGIKNGDSKWVMHIDELLTSFRLPFPGAYRGR